MREEMNKKGYPSEVRKRCNVLLLNKKIFINAL